MSDKHRTIRIDRKHFFLTAEPGIGWFRLFGRGFGWKDTRRHRLLFSERNGYVRRLGFGIELHRAHTKHVMIGPWSFAWLGAERRPGAKA